MIQGHFKVEASGAAIELQHEAIKKIDYELAQLFSHYQGAPEEKGELLAGQGKGSTAETELLTQQSSVHQLARSLLQACAAWLAVSEL